MKYTCVRKNNMAAFFISVMALLGVLSVFLSFSGIWSRGFFEFLALVFGVVIIFILQKYIMSYYEYILDTDEDVESYNRLTVIQVMGKRRTSLYTAPLSSLTAVIPYRKMRKVEKEYGKVGAKMSFCADILPKESYLLVFEDGNELALVRLQCDGRFASKIEERAGF